MEQIKPAVIQEVLVSQAQAPSAKKSGHVVKKLPADSGTKVKLVVAGLVVVLAGVGTGWALAGASLAVPAPGVEVVKNPETAGEVDESVFTDTAYGILREGGIEGEGTHYLDTGAGPEKYVYLFSTVLDLTSFVGKKVEVRGQTLAAEKAGWLMDVGSIKEIQ